MLCGGATEVLEVSSIVRGAPASFDSAPRSAVLSKLEDEAFRVAERVRTPCDTLLSQEQLAV